MLNQKPTNWFSLIFVDPKGEDLFHFRIYQGAIPMFIWVSINWEAFIRHTAKNLEIDWPMEKLISNTLNVTIDKDQCDRVDEFIGYLFSTAYKANSWYLKLEIGYFLGINNDSEKPDVVISNAGEIRAANQLLTTRLNNFFGITQDYPQDDGPITEEQKQKLIEHVGISQVPDDSFDCMFDEDKKPILNETDEIPEHVIVVLHHRFCEKCQSSGLNLKAAKYDQESRTFDDDGVQLLWSYFLAGHNATNSTGGYYS